MRCAAFLLFLHSMYVSGQSLVPAWMAELPGELSEPSGLLVVEGFPWTIMDSGGAAALYQIDPASGDLLRTVSLTNATNVDLEALAMDDQYVYVGDIGNNAGARTDLRIYRFPSVELLDPLVVAVEVDTIMYTYADQVDHTPAFDANAYDAEAMVAVADSLFIFTKGWLSQHTRFYALPATPGVHVAQLRDSLGVSGMVTDASRNAVTGRVELLGHTSAMEPFLCALGEFPGTHFFSGTVDRLPLNTGPVQMEGVAWVAENEVWMTNEVFGSQPAGLWRSAADATIVEEHISSQHRSFPNPTAQVLYIAYDGVLTASSVYDRTGNLVQSLLDPSSRTLSTEGLTDGTYILELIGDRGTQREVFVVLRH